MLIKTRDGKTHQINETLFRELENRFLIVEGDDIRLFEDNKVNANDMIVAMLKQNGYDISQIKDKRQRDFILQQLNAKVAENPQNIKQIVADFAANPDSLTNPQNQETQNNQEQQPETNNQEQNNQQNQEQGQEENPEQTNDENNQDNSENKEPTQQQQVEIDKNTKAMLAIVQNSKYINEILKLANKGQQEPKDVYDIDPTLLINTAVKYTPFIKELLSERLDKGLERVNLSNNAKAEIKNIFNSDCNKQSAIPNIISKNAVTSHNPNMNVFQFPVAKYYVSKYNKAISKECVNKLVEGLIENNKGNGLFSSKSLGNLAKNIGLDKKETNPNNIKGLINKKYPDDFILYVIQHNNKLNTVDDLKNADAEEIAEIFMSDELAGVDIINAAVTVLKSAMNDNGFLPFIDYIINVNYDVKNSSDDDNNYAIKVNLFNDYGASSISQQMRDICQADDLPYTTASYKVKVSAFYQDVTNVEFKSTENNEHCYIRFVKGFAWLERIKKSFNKGAQAGRNVKGMFSHMKR